MRVIIMTAVIVFCSTKLLAQCDTIISAKDSLVKNYLLKLDVDSYKGMQIESFLKMDSIRDFCQIRFLQEPQGVCIGLTARYKGFINLRIRISQKECGGFVGDSKTWDMEKLKRCKIYKLERRDYTNLK